MTGLHKVFDAAFPPSSAPPWAQGAAGYVWRPKFATHVWTPAQWLPFAHLRQFPIAVPDLNNSPAAEAAGILAAVEALGWAPHLPEPNTRVIIIDGETSVFPAWYEETAGLIGQGGYVAVDYGSLSYVVSNAAADLWVADWNDVPALQPGQTIHGDQYQAGIAWQNTQVDASVFDDWLFNRGGIGARHQKGLPIVSPSTTTVPVPTMDRAAAQQFRDAWNAEVKTLSGKNRAQLAELERAELAKTGAQRLFGGPSSKDELIGAILEYRYPIARLNESTHVLHHGPGEIWSACQYCHPHAGVPCECGLGSA